jgi:hypothetical protein
MNQPRFETENTKATPVIFTISIFSAWLIRPLSENGWHLLTIPKGNDFLGKSKGGVISFYKIW